MSKGNLSESVFSPDRAVDTTFDYIEKQIGNPVTGIKPLVPGLGEKLDPWKAGDLIGVLAFTSNGKSSFVSFLINQHAYALRSIRQEHPEYNHIIAMFSWEQPIEQMIGVDFSRMSNISVSDILYGKITKMQLEKLKQLGRNRKELPIWLIGHSIHERRDRPLLSMPEVNQILMWIEDQGFVIDLIVLDYLQRIRPLVADRVEGFSQICTAARTMAIRSPVILNSQAKRECFERAWAMPLLNDSQWTSNFEQECTHVHALWRPWQNKLETVKIGATKYTVNEKMLLHEILKQSLGPTNFTSIFEMGFGGTYLIPWGEKAPDATALQNAFLEGMKKPVDWDEYRKQKGVK